VSVRSRRAAAAGVALYQNAQALEAMTRTEKDRIANAPKIAEIKSQLTNQRFVDGFGSMAAKSFSPTSTSATACAAPVARSGTNGTPDHSENRRAAE
jgi:hypothetical protein